MIRQCSLVHSPRYRSSSHRHDSYPSLVIVFRWLRLFSPGVKVPSRHLFRQGSIRVNVPHLASKFLFTKSARTNMCVIFGILFTLSAILHVPLYIFKARAIFTKDLWLWSFFISTKLFNFNDFLSLNRNFSSCKPALTSPQVKIVTKQIKIFTLIDLKCEPFEKILFLNEMMPWRSMWPLAQRNDIWCPRKLHT